MDQWERHWKARHSSYPYFNRDGIVNDGQWEQIPEGKHILVVLKETNGLEGSLAEFLDHGGNDTYYRTWNQVARWVQMILYGTYLDRVDRETLNRTVQKIAVINLKKYAGGKTAKAREVKAAAMEDLPLLKRQVRLYQPDIILTGGWGLVSNFLHDEILEEGCAWKNPYQETASEENPDLWYFWTRRVWGDKPTLVVSMPHPNRAAKKWTMELQKLLRKEEF